MTAIKDVVSDRRALEMIEGYDFVKSNWNDNIFIAHWISTAYTIEVSEKYNSKQTDWSDILELAKSVSKQLARPFAPCNVEHYSWNGTDKFLTVFQFKIVKD